MTEYKGKSSTELHNTLAEKQEALRVFRFGMAGGKSKNVKEGRAHRKEIARILTELNSSAK